MRFNADGKAVYALQSKTKTEDEIIVKDKDANLLKLRPLLPAKPSGKKTLEEWHSHNFKHCNEISEIYLTALQEFLHLNPHFICHIKANNFKTYLNTVLYNCSYNAFKTYPS